MATHYISAEHLTIERIGEIIRNGEKLELSEEAKQLLLRCRWSGNIRELQNCIEKAVIYSETELVRAEDLQIRASELTEVQGTQAESLEDAEEKVIRQAMKQYNGNLSLVAKALKISRPTLYSRLKKYEI